jgi:hypothetical protein
MAAITPFLEEYAPDITVAESEALSLPADASEASGTLEDEVGADVAYDLEGVGRVGDERVFMTGQLTADVLSLTHSKLLTNYFVREGSLQVLMDRGIQYWVQERDRQGARPGKLFIVLDRPVGESGTNELPWNPSDWRQQQFKVLSWTSKMGCPSFSLPAGALQVGGACPGAVAGQSIVPVGDMLSAAKNVRDNIHRPVRLQQAVCQYCYATKGKYATSGVQYAQLMRYIWTADALRSEEGTDRWVEAMVYAIDNADYLLDGGKDESAPKITYAPERFDGRFFRIHDSGDFFSPKYLRAWKRVADALPDILFWAPSRVWAATWGSPLKGDAVNEINNPPRNLIIRPSSFHINDPAPPSFGPGWAEGTAVFRGREGYKAADPMYRADIEAAVGHGFDWECLAYSKDAGDRTCRNADAPDGEPGCRACWIDPDLQPMYGFH